MLLITEKFSTRKILRHNLKNTFSGYRFKFLSNEFGIKCIQRENITRVMKYRLNTLEPSLVQNITSNPYPFWTTILIFYWNKNMKILMNILIKRLTDGRYVLEASSLFCRAATVILYFFLHGISSFPAILTTSDFFQRTYCQTVIWTLWSSIPASAWPYIYINI